MADLRTQRTKKAIADAFIKLVNQTSFKEVTVAMIAKEAMINRQTFYRHYEDKYQLTKSLLKEFIDNYQTEIDRTIPLIKNNSDLKHRLKYMEPIIDQFIFERIELVKALKNIKFDNFNYETELQKLYRSVIQQLFNEGEPLTDFQVRVVTNILQAVIDYLIDNGSLPSNDEIESMQKIMLRFFK